MLLDLSLLDQINESFFEQSDSKSSVQEYLLKYDQRINARLSSGMQKLSAVLMSQLEQLVQSKVQTLLSQELTKLREQSQIRTARVEKPPMIYKSPERGEDRPVASRGPEQLKNARTGSASFAAFQSKFKPRKSPSSTRREEVKPQDQMQVNNMKLMEVAAKQTARQKLENHLLAKVSNRKRTADGSRTPDSVVSSEFDATSCNQ